MGGFLHFVETELQGLSSDELKACGLGHAFTKAPASRSSKLALDGKPPVAGLLLWQSTDFKDGQGVNVDKQKWRLRGTFDGRRVWTGFNTDDPPTPEVLFLGRTLGHFAWTDSKGRVWQVPWVGCVDDEGIHHPLLPRELDFDTNGTPSLGSVVLRYMDLWDSGQSLWDAHMNGQAEDPQSVALYAAKCLGTLYRVTLPELNLLGSFSQEAEHSPATLVVLALGVHRFNQWRKEKETDPFAHSSTTPECDTGGGSAEQ